MSQPFWSLRSTRFRGRLSRLEAPGGKNFEALRPKPQNKNSVRKWWLFRKDFSIRPVSYTHLDVYKRQLLVLLNDIILCIIIYYIILSYNDIIILYCVIINTNTCVFTSNMQLADIKTRNFFDPCEWIFSVYTPSYWLLPFSHSYLTSMYTAEGPALYKLCAMTNILFYQQ